MDERWEAVEQLRLNFVDFPDKEEASNDLLALTKDKNYSVQERAAYALCSTFIHNINKEKVSKIILDILKDDYSNLRGMAINAFAPAFQHIMDKEDAWKTLIELTKEGDSYVREGAASILTHAFQYMPDKEKASKSLIELTKDEDSDVRRGAVNAIIPAFQHITDKKGTWKDLLKLTNDGDIDVRREAVNTLVPAFKHMANKEKAWNDLLSLTNYKRSFVRRGTASALGFALCYIKDKEPASNDLIALTKDENLSVIRGATYALGFAFPYMPNKEEASKTLIELTKEEDSLVRGLAVSALGIAFTHMTDKKEALKTLLKLSKNEDVSIVSRANHSLGRISILKATETDMESFRKELEDALVYFEKSAKRGVCNPARFCLPFYRSFYAITFRKYDAKVEVKKFIKEAKEASEGSESREKLLEAIENLSNALTEVQKARSFGEIQGDLTAYSRYCNRVADLLVEIEGDAPGATGLIRKGLPIIDKRIKETLFEIEENAKKFCKESQQTKFKNISRSAYDNVKGLGEIDNPISVEIRLDRLIPIIRDMCDILPEESREFVCGQLDEINDVGLGERTIIVESAFNCIRTQQKGLQKKLSENAKDNEFLKDDILSKLDNISFGISKLKIRSGEIVPSLRNIEKELDKLKPIETKLNGLESSLTEFKHLTENDIQRLNDEITRLALEIETKVIPKLPKTSDTHAILDELNKLKQSDKEIWFNRVSGMSSLIGLLISIFSTG
ncbi:MAG: HEAT repeat domain-containing protein [Spirochaetes bacterium]|nr:HEAT repeat domain-containing protein [Spirochaetota bacterium]